MFERRTRIQLELAKLISQSLRKNFFNCFRELKVQLKLAKLISQSLQVNFFRELKGISFFHT